MSVYGTAEHMGALVLSVEDGSVSDITGLREGDVIVDWGGLKIRDADALTDSDDISACRPIRVLRKQKEMLL